VDVIGLGTDLVECVRVRSLIDRHAEVFLRRVYTKHEICVCRSSVRSTEAFAGRWAAKEAVLKSLGVIERAPHRTDVEIRSLGGTPQVILLGPTQERATELGVSGVMLAVAMTRKYATATAMAVRS
jgi:holo-[acyl-carrier protein] synthase